MSKSGWVIDTEKKIYGSKVLDVYVRSCHSEDGRRSHDFFAMKSRNWANIIPVTRGGKIVMVRQYRAGIDQFTLEVPGGVIDPSDPDNISGALREMTEETGYTPSRDARTLELGWVHPNPAIMDNRCYSFVIGPVEKSTDQDLDYSEMIEVVEVPIRELAPLIINGTINHALMLNAFFFLGLHSESGQSVLSNELGRFQRTQSPR